MRLDDPLSQRAKMKRENMFLKQFKRKILEELKNMTLAFL